VCKRLSAASSVLSALAAAGMLLTEARADSGAEPASTPTRFDETIRALVSRGIPVDPAAAELGAIEAILRAADPGARLLQDGEADAAPAPPPSVSVTNGIARVRANSIGPALVSLLRDGAAKWPQDGVGGLVLDLRDASGNDVGALSAVAELFAGEKDAFLFRLCSPGGRPIRVQRSAGAGVLAGRWPVIVLMNGDTGGCAEVLAAFMKGRHGFLLAGEPASSGGRMRSKIGIADRTALVATLRADSVVEGPAAFRETLRPDIETGADDSLCARASDILVGLMTLKKGKADAGTTETPAP